MLIHASKSRTSYEYWTPVSWREQFGCDLPSWESLAKGAIVGVVDVDTMLTASAITGPARRWASGPWCWVLKNPRAFAEPIPFRGQQSLFDVPGELVQGLMMPSAVA